MNSSLYIGATGMKGLSEGMQVTTNNLANVSTIGFKKQDILFSDTIYQTQAAMGNWWNAQEDSRVAIGQVGMGLQVEAVRTSYQQGALESTNTMTDLAINGKGFFQVTDGTNEYYTRAGDFRQDDAGVWRTPTGLALNGFKINENGERGELSAVTVDKFMTMAPKATTAVNLTMNLGSVTDSSVSADNPYFSLLDQYDARTGSQLPSDAYSAAQEMTVYDAEGVAHKINAYFDGAPSSGGSRYVEFLLAADQSAETEVARDSGLLMTGVLEFDSSGNLINVSAFTPGGDDAGDLANWTRANLVDGVPALELNGESIGINFGLSSESGWADGATTAAEVGTNPALLGGLDGELTRSAFPTAAFGASSLISSYSQNGYQEGFLSYTSVGSDGVITGTFSNGQSMDLWEIPVCRFTSEDGLRREGGNLFSAAPEAGTMEMGTAGTENYGEIMAYNIENSNVDLAQEMVSMIINQRGFQSNSKVVTTADEMLRKALELKR